MNEYTVEQQPKDPRLPRLPVPNPNVEPEIYPPFKGGKRSISRGKFLHQISDSLSSAAVNCKLEAAETLLAYNTVPTVAAPLSESLQAALSKQHCFKNTAQEKAHTVALALTEDISNK
jgi:hypothetical protein